MKQLILIWAMAAALLCGSDTYIANKFVAEDTAPYFGVYPATYQQTWGLNVGRRVVYASMFRGGTAYTDSILLNVNWNYYHTYGKDSAKYGKAAYQIYNYLHPKMVIVENEELLGGDLVQYCKNLKAAVNRLKSKATNGGITMRELGIWYYMKTGDSLFFVRNVATNLKAGILAREATYVNDSTRVAYELNAIKNMDSLTLWNVHFYCGYANQWQGVVRCINYTSTFLGKRAMSNEFGTYSTAAGMIDSAVSVAKQTKMYWGIAYSGTGMIGKAVPINKTTYITLTHQ